MIARRATRLPMTANNVRRLLARFKCQRCVDSCCLKATDGIALQSNEDARLASALGIPVSRFKAEYTFTRGGRRLMVAPCPFYKSGCSIYSIRPQVCRQYPFNHSDSKGNITINPNCPGARV